MHTGDTFQTLRVLTGHNLCRSTWYHWEEREYIWRERGLGWLGMSRHTGKRPRPPALGRLVRRFALPLGAHSTYLFADMVNYSSLLRFFLIFRWSVCLPSPRRCWGGWLFPGGVFDLLPAVVVVSEDACAELPRCAAPRRAPSLIESNRREAIQPGSSRLSSLV